MENFFDDDIHKDKYADFVYLDKTEKERLEQKYGRFVIAEYIFRLNEHIAIHGKQKDINSHYHMLLRWLREDKPVNKDSSLFSADNTNISLSELELLMNGGQGGNRHV